MNVAELNEIRNLLEAKLNYIVTDPGTGYFARAWKISEERRLDYQILEKVIAFIDLMKRGENDQGGEGCGRAGTL